MVDGSERGKSKDTYSGRQTRPSTNPRDGGDRDRSAGHKSGPDFGANRAESTRSIREALTGGTAFLRPGERFAGYEIYEELARGGVGIIYRAGDGRSAHQFALKILLDMSFEQGKRRLTREAATLSRLEHSNIVAFHNFSFISGLPYLVTEYIPGPTLRECIEQAPLDIPRTLDVFTAIASALAYCHARGIVHRDIKPSNIVLREGREPILLDFDLAKRNEIDGEAPLFGTVTLANVPHGTPAYMSPEQVDTESQGEVNTATDCWSFGACLYTALTGHAPFSSATAPRLYMAILNKPAAPVETLRPDVPIWLSQLCTACLAKESGCRPAMDQVVDALRTRAFDATS